MPKAPATSTKSDLKLAGNLAEGAALCGAGNRAAGLRSVVDPSTLDRASERDGALRVCDKAAGVE